MHLAQRPVARVAAHPEPQVVGAVGRVNLVHLGIFGGQNLRRVEVVGPAEQHLGHALDRCQGRLRAALVAHEVLHLVVDQRRDLGFIKAAVRDDLRVLHHLRGQRPALFAANLPDVLQPLAPSPRGPRRTREAQPGPVGADLAAGPDHQPPARDRLGAALNLALDELRHRAEAVEVAPAVDGDRRTALQLHRHKLARAGVVVGADFHGIGAVVQEPHRLGQVLAQWALQRAGLPVEAEVFRDEAGDALGQLALGRVGELRQLKPRHPTERCSHANRGGLHDLRV